jgi:mannosyltransferase OCH1-like enzyme
VGEGKEFEEAVQKLKAKYKQKILLFNKYLPTTIDANGMPKLIHLTCKNKNNIDNPIWRECLQKYREMYPDYAILIYDNQDIYDIIQRFDKHHLETVKNIHIGAVLADVFRYLILYIRGGYYSDMDCFSVKPFYQLCEPQYHGNHENIFYIYPRRSLLPNAMWDFYETPCDHCVPISTQNGGVQAYKCLGHSYITEKTNIIVGKEYDKVWHEALIRNIQKKQIWTDQEIGVCQWFIAAKPREKLFLHCYFQSIENVIHQPLNPHAPDYHYQVINTTGPLFFTKMVNRFLSKYASSSWRDQIAILPCDYFCCGSYGTVPITKNQFIQHKYTGTWLK